MNDLLKQRVLCAFAGFNMTVMCYMLYRTFTGVKISWAWYSQQAMIAAGLGIVVGAVVFVVVGKLQK